MTEYSLPVRALIGMGEAEWAVWPDYRELSLTREHGPELISILTDPAFLDDHPVTGWAPLHAWRALGQLGVTEAAPELVRMLDHCSDSDWGMEEVPRVLAMLGPPALDHLEPYLADRSKDEFARASAAAAIRTIGVEHPEQRVRCVTSLRPILDDFEDNSIELNSLVMNDLVDLRAVEVAPLIERLFREGHVDPRHMGDWEDVQIELGLLEERITPRQPYRDPYEIGPPPRDAAERPRGAKAKAKRKAARASRRRNRR